MAYIYETVSTGGWHELSRIIDDETAHIPEGGLAELRVNFRVRFPLFLTAANQLEQELASRGVRPWPREARRVFVDEENAAWYIRWQKGAPWAPAVVAALLAIAFVIALLVVAWVFLRVTPVNGGHPSLVDKIALITATVGVAWLIFTLRKTGHLPVEEWLERLKRR
jgi:hypothetical protein